MGMYNTYGNTFEQLKVGECVLKHYCVGDKVDMPDGIYHGHDRIIVINNNIFVADMSKWQVYDNYGDIIEAGVR